MLGSCKQGGSKAAFNDLQVRKYSMKEKSIPNAQHKLRRSASLTLIEVMVSAAIIAFG